VKGSETEEEREKTGLSKMGVAAKNAQADLDD